MSQSEQLELAVAEMEPGAQGKHVDEPLTLANVPLAHSLQMDA
jgi:hypothetical protein